jgi:hypothetical protein
VSSRGYAIVVLLTVGLLCAPASPASAATRTFRARIGHALGIVPPAGRQEIALGTNIPVVYHGGPVMRNVTVHTIFWAPNGYGFAGAPSPSSLGYEPLLQRFLADSAHDSGSTSNVFSVLGQFGDGSSQGSYNVGYSVAGDSIDDTNPYPAAGHQCASASGVATCVTDLQLEHEVDRVIQAHAPNARGLGNVWIVYLPPDVDTCLAPGSCGSNAFGGYHSAFDLGHGTTIYANIPDPLIETTIPQGSDPQGNPDAESAADVTAHELVEAITDPIGDGWMDPNGNEVGDKCENGPGRGAPLGFAPDGSPYNQLINGSRYLVQTMWSNAQSGCVQRSGARTSALPLAQVHLTQFSPAVSGTIPSARAGVGVLISLVRAGSEVARVTTSTRADGTWGPVAMMSLSRRSRHAVGDDRDEIDVIYGAGGPRDDVILTGDGGNPFIGAGWTGWYALDNGYAIVSNRTRGAIALEPCAQTGVLGLAINGVSTGSPIDTCEPESGASIVHTGPLAAGTTIRMTSADNRAVSPVNPDGALVSLMIPLGEPNSTSGLGNTLVPITPTGFPACTADLQSGVVRCTGLVAGARYVLDRVRGNSRLDARAGSGGQIRATGFRRPRRLTGGDMIRLSNAAGRTLTVLHVAHLRVNIAGSSTVIKSGLCEPGDYYGAALSTPPASSQIGHGPAGTGAICPLGGSAAGLSAAAIMQSDDLSSGQTRLEVPQILDTAPSEDSTVYGRFVALAGAGLPGANGSTLTSGAAVSLTITPAGGHRAVFRAKNVNTARGVAVHSLRAGVYRATWILTDANGDTRTVQTRFVEV